MVVEDQEVGDRLRRAARLGDDVPGERPPYRCGRAAEIGRPRQKLGERVAVRRIARPGGRPVEGADQRVERLGVALGEVGPEAEHLLRSLPPQAPTW